MPTTSAIVLYCRPHSDKAHILHTYTRTGGRVNYMVYGIGKKKSAALYAPLSLVEITGTGTPNGQKMPVAKEIRLQRVPQRILTDMRRQTIALFTAEVLYRTLRHPMEDPALFDYIAASAEALDSMENPENLHLTFLVGLAEHLGFAIDSEAHPDLLKVPHTRTERQQQLQALCTYYEKHVDDWQTPRSIEVLTEVFN